MSARPIKFLPTFSRLPIAKRCVFPWTAHAPRWPKRPDTSYNTTGRAVSKVAESLAIWGEAPVESIAAEEGLTPGDAKKVEHMTVHLRELLRSQEETDQWRCAETALAYDLRTGTAREMKQDGPRDYSDQRPGEMMGTPDLVRMTREGRLIVPDYKTGRYQWGASPSESDQMRALGLAAARAYHVHEVTLEFIQVDEDGVRGVDKGETLDAFELACAADELRQIYDRIAGPPEPPKPGPWCTSSYCPLVGVCPATKTALKEIDRASQLKHPITGGASHPLTVEITSPDHASYTLDRLKAVSESVAVILEAVKDYVRTNGPVPYGDKLWGAVQCDGRERVDLAVDGAQAAVERHLGPFVAAMAIERKTSRTALEAAAKAAQEKKGDGVRAVRSLFADLREMGALKQGAPFEKFEAFVPRNSD